MYLNKVREALRWYIWGAVVLVTLLIVGTPAQAQGTAMSQGSFQQTNLVSDIPGLAPITDANLSNAWGIVAGPQSPFWISDNNTGVSTLYTGTGQIVPLVVTIPSAPGSPAGTIGSPTGTVFNGKDEFHVSKMNVTAPALFLFATEDGTISGWNPKVDGTHAIIAANNPSAVYKGLALASTPQGDFLYAANLKTGTIDVFDSNFAPKHFLGTGNFKNRFLPPGFAPFNVASFNNLIYVSYARQNAQKNDVITGAGQGIIDAFDDFGDFLFRVVSHGRLNAPWGMVIAPANFGAFSGDLLVGNFGDGKINAYNPVAGLFMGTISDAQGNPIVNDHIWGLSFGNGAAAGPTNTLFFTAGIRNQSHGLFGQIVPTM